jgi:effector-binding domain-containing protein
MAFEFKIEERPAQPAVTIRTRTSMEGLPAFFDRAFGEVHGHISQAGQHPSGPAFALYHTQDPSDFDLEAGFPVAAPVAGNGDVKASEIPGGKVCTTLLVGPYEGLESDTWGYEVYISDPTTVAPEEIQTQIVLPLK